MLLIRFFRAIDHSFIGRFVEKKHSEILNTDPDRIYIENVRSFFNITTRLAKFLCEMAVRQNYFKRKIGIICKNESCERIILTVEDAKQIPLNVDCINCQLNEFPIFEFDSKTLNTIIYYQLIRPNG